MILVTAIAERILVIRKTLLFAEVCAAAAQPRQAHIVVATTGFSGDNHLKSRRSATEIVSLLPAISSAV